MSRTIQPTAKIWRGGAEGCSLGALTVGMSCSQWLKQPST